ncbi:MAG: archemetzincin [Archaeoglobaceae archaeon]
MNRTVLSRDEETGELKVNKKVYIHPLVDSQPVDSKIIDYIQEELHKIFEEVTVLKEQKIPDSAFDRSREQFKSAKVLEVIGLAGDINLGVLEGDLYSYGFNFIFGEAELGGSKAVISTCRLRPQFYGKDEDIELLKLRALKEAVHEIGHIMGLRLLP